MGGFDFVLLVPPPECEEPLPDVPPLGEAPPLEDEVGLGELEAGAEAAGVGTGTGTGAADGLGVAAGAGAGTGTLFTLELGAGAGVLAAVDTECLGAALCACLVAWRFGVAFLATVAVVGAAAGVVAAVDFDCWAAVPPHPATTRPAAIAINGVFLSTLAPPDRD